MAKEVNRDKLVELLKKNPEEPESFYADKLGVSRTIIGPAIWACEPIANPKLKFAANKANIVKARKDGIRWERIAARTGESVAEVKRIGGAEAAKIYTGRGRPVGDGATSGGSKTSGGRAGGRAGRGTSGRRAAASGNSGSGKKPAGRRNRTRADRAAASGDPK
jgi:hypothetical protein